MHADANSKVFAPGFVPYRVTTVRGTRIHLIVMGDSVVASDHPHLVGSKWLAYRIRVERGGALVEDLSRGEPDDDPVGGAGPTAD